MKQLSFDIVVASDHFRDIQAHIVRAGWKFHEENPHVFELFKAFCADLRNAGRKRYGAKAIVERIRWHLDVETKGDQFKINNNFPAFYSRLLMIEDPSFVDFFQTRSTQGVA